MRFANVELDVPEPIQVEDLASDLPALDVRLGHAEPHQCVDIDRLAQVHELHALGQVGCGWCKHVARVQRRRDGAERMPLGGDGHGLRHTVHGLPRRIEDPVVRADEQPTAPRPDREIAIPADARIDDSERDRVVAHEWQGIGEQEGPGAYVERRDAVRQVDHPASRRDPIDDRVTDPDPLVAIAEVREEDDWARHGS